MRDVSLCPMGSSSAFTKKRTLGMRHLLALGALLLGLHQAASAQILIGQTADFSGGLSNAVKETLSGAKLYFDAVNARGGIAGQKIELISMDDKYDPQIAAANA